MINQYRQIYKEEKKKNLNVKLTEADKYRVCENRVDNRFTLIVTENEEIELLIHFHKFLH